MGPLLPIAALGIGLHLLTQDDPKKKSNGGIAPVPPELQAMATEMRFPGGTPVRYFKDAAAATIGSAMVFQCVEPTTVQGQDPGGLLYKLVGPMPGCASGADVLAEARSKGFCVLGTTTLTLVASDVDKYLLVVPARDRIRATAASSWAVLVDPGVATTPADIAPRGDALGFPFVIQSGDIPSKLAAYYTGDGNRWREIAAANPHLGMVATDNLHPWKVGQEIYLPAEWNAGSKPRPGPAGPAPIPPTGGL